MTGSSTTWAGAHLARFSATTSITGRWPSMPILTASMRTSVNSVSICKPTKAGGTGEMPVTPWVFWAVRAAMTAQP
ncbi:hypothetical protein G6F65_016248 [Rhizopus arrhizus]|nr:hypothetical protein G6F65_016248 [Rhizopus arrhizus]